MWLVYQSGAIIPVWNSDLHSPHLGTFQVIPQAWSVALELMFYAMAPFLVRTSLARASGHNCRDLRITLSGCCL